MVEYTKKGAVLSGNGRYRNALWRQWAWGHPASPRIEEGKNWRGGQYGDPLALVVIGLNPSTADAEVDDPTIRRCVAFAQREGFYRLEMINLFAHRATSPLELLALRDHMEPVGPENKANVARAIYRAGKIVCAWGAHGGHLGQDETMLGWVEDANFRKAPVLCFGRTKEGHPKHPLYLPKNAPLSAFNGRGHP